MKYLPIQINQEWHLKQDNPYDVTGRDAFPHYKDFEQQAITNAKPIINHDGREWYDSKDLQPIEQYYNDIRGDKACWMDIPTWMKETNKDGWTDYKTRQIWKYIGEKPVEKLTEQQILQQPKELFMEQQLRNNMPEGYKAAKLIDLFSYMFRMGFENGMNWQKEQENVAERTRIIGIIQAELKTCPSKYFNLYEDLLTKINNK